MNIYFDKKPKAAKIPRKIQLVIFFSFKLFQLYNTVKAQNGSWQTFTLNSGVVKLKKYIPDNIKTEINA